MKLKLLASLALATFGLCGCDDSTEDIGQSLIDNADRLTIGTDTFAVASRSVAADSVLSRNTTGYVGKVRDPETGAYITGNFMTQFHTLEDYDMFPAQSTIRSLDANGEVVADSCELRLYYDSSYGDSLTVMKMTVEELGHPMLENRKYYTNFDPEKEGYIREGGIKKEKVYTLADLTTSKEERESSDYTPNIRVTLNAPYTDKNGTTYNNYGTYLMREFYRDKSNFGNSLKFTKNIVPGFYFKNESGLGAMAYVNIVQLNVYYRYLAEEVDSVVDAYGIFAGNEEVLQTSTITNDEATIGRLVADNSCTYLKTPAGIFTEITLPIDEVFSGTHANDTVNSAQLILQRINNETSTPYTLDQPATLLLLPEDSLFSFFENDDIANYKTSFLATFTSSNNTYTFSNISGLVTAMKQKKGTSANWNKAVIVPVTTTYTTVGTSNVLTRVVHDMSLTSTKLIGGSGTPYGGIKLNVVYSRFK